MSLPRPDRRFLFLSLLLVVGVALVYLWLLSGTGLIGPDEPRYASIGRAMAESGDWITPTLWSDPWFEKPPLLYWIQAAGWSAGLGDHLAPRVPVALLSVAFLGFFLFAMRRLEDAWTALAAASILATTAGWAVYSQIGVTDLPLAAAFNAAVLAGLLWLRESRRLWLLLAGVFAGLAILAKGLVPLVLFLPLLWMARREWKRGLLGVAVALLVALPWYLAMTVQYGREFFDEFFLRHHFQRFSTGEQLHAQPFWFYFPVLLLGLFPWTPLMSLWVGPARRELWAGATRRTILLTSLFGLVFFSAASGKLPGYLLPLWPSLCVLLAIPLRSAGARRSLTASMFLLGLVPVIARVLPDAMLLGLSRARWGDVPYASLAIGTGLAVGVYLVDRFRGRALAFGLTASMALASILVLKISVFPLLDRVVSARSLWFRIEPNAQRTCVASLHRSWRYGLNYYSRSPLPDCEDSPREIHVEQAPGGLPVLSLRGK